MLLPLIVVCGALTDGDERYPRPDGELCHCKEGWGGINCNGKLGSACCQLQLIISLQE
jgi:hypothetical protein